MSGRVRTDSTAAANTAVACGAGIGFAPLWLVRSLVDRGEVEIILEEFEVARVPIHAVWLPTRVPLAKAQLFAEAVTAIETEAIVTAYGCAGSRDLRFYRNPPDCFKCAGRSESSPSRMARPLSMNDMDQNCSGDLGLQ